MSKKVYIFLGEVGFSEYGVGEHGDAVGCLDPGGFFDRYGFDVDSGAAEKVYYGQTFNVFESVGEEDVYFFTHFGCLLFFYFVFF